MNPKILFIHASADQGGVELRSLDVCSRLKHNFQLGVLFHCHPGPLAEAYSKEGIPHWTVAFPRFWPAFNTIRQFRPDIIHIFGMKTNIFWRPILYAAGYRRLIGQIAGLTNSGKKPNPFRIALDRSTHGLLRAYVTVSQTVARQLVNFGFDETKLRVIRDGITPFPYLQKSPVPQPPKIVTIGNLRVVKGHRYLLEALHILNQQGFEFEAWFIGEGPERDHLSSQSERLGLGQKVRFWGNVNNTRLRELIPEAAIFALLSLSEGIPVAAMEAMSAGLPVVASDVGGMSELIEDQVEGLLVPVGDISRAAACLAKLLEQPTLRNEMGRRARHKIESQFSLDQMVTGYEILYRDLVSTPC